MEYKIRHSIEALKEIRESHRWNENRSAGLGKRFVDLIDYTISMIKLNPEGYP